MKKRFIATIMLAAAPWVCAQTYPTKPITLVVSVPAGGTIDAIARMLGKDLSEQLQQPVVIENKAGANGNIAADTVRRAPADGHTLLMLASSTLTLGPHVMEKVPFDPIKDFTPVAMTAGLNMALLTHPAQGFQNYAAFAEALKRQPGAFNYSSTGNGSFAHVAGALLNLEAKTQSTHIAYKGLAPSIQDLLAGVVQYSFDSGSASHVKSGKLHALAVMGPERSAVLPDVPTFRELGLPELEKISGWHGVFAPAGTPQSVVKRLNQEINRILQRPHAIERIQSMGFESVTQTPEQLGEVLQRDYRNYGELIRKTGISVQ